MPSQQSYLQMKRRDFLTTAASGLGGVALASMLQNETLGATTAENAAANPLSIKPPDFAPKAKSCIFFFLAGGPSQVDLYDSKPLLNERDGLKLPDSFLENTEFAFIDKTKAVLKGTTTPFHKRGQCGIEYSDLVENIGSCADDIALIRSMTSNQFNHHPAQLLLSTGKSAFGRPTIGSWLLYGLGNECDNLPGYVVLTAGRGASGSASNWSSGFLPSTYQGVPFRNQGEPVLNLSNPPGISTENQRHTLDIISRLNQRQFQRLHDPEIASRISQYELAFRMQAAAPELTDLSGETKTTLENYGIGRKTPRPAAQMQSGDTYSQFSTNCLLARRLVERGVRFVNIIHASWDQHSNLKYDLEWNARAVDQPIAALLRDLKQRGLLDETLVVWGSEFGRTPLGQGGNGRDHHPDAFTMWMAGGGIKGGIVHGMTDDVGYNVVEDAVPVNDFQATLLHLFGLKHKKLTVNFKGLEVRLTNLAGNVVHKIIA